MPTIVSTGQLTISDLMDGLNARLSSESHVLPALNDGQATNFTGCETTMSVFQGNQDDTANWSFSAVATGLTGSLVGSTYTVTGMSGDVGFVDITANKSGQPNITARFSVAKARKGDAGPSINLVSSGQGFTFQDDAATPSAQNMAVTVIRQGTNDPVTFVASNGKPVRTDLGQLAVLGYLVGAPGVGRGDTAYFDLSDLGDDRQVTITAFCGAMSASVTLLRLDFSTAAAGATRNVYRGIWAVGQAYEAGDAVIDGGYGWSAGAAHTSAVGNRPPVYPTASNAFWSLTTVKGEDGAQGAPGISAILSNESHSFPANSVGSVSSYVGSGTEIRVYEGAAQLSYDGVGTANGTWRVNTLGTNITVGTLTDSGAHLTVGDHSGVAQGTDLSSVLYTITGKTAGGASFTMTKVQSFTKSKAGTIGVDGAPGPAVMMVSDRPATFTSTDGVLDTGQANIVLTANTQGLVSPTFAWTFSGLQTNPTASTTASQTITAAQFGTSKAAIVVVTVNGSIVDKMTLVRLERSTAAAGATVGGTIGVNIGGQITAGNASTYIANAAIGSAQIGSIALVGTSNFSVKSGVSGQRMEMDSRVIKIFDASGVLRVQLGDLTL